MSASVKINHTENFYMSQQLSEKAYRIWSFLPDTQFQWKWFGTYNVAYTMVWHAIKLISEM